MKKLINIVPLYIVIVLFIQSCAPTKNTFVRRNYHNVTSRYNTYFNGNEALKEAIQDLNKAAIDNYNEILPIYPTATSIQAQSANTQLDKAILKASTTIQKHSFELHGKKGKEYCNWIDNSYLLIGKSYFYKQNYREAKETFDFIAKRYEGPEKYEALLWFVRTMNELNKFEETRVLLDMITSKQGKKSTNNFTNEHLPIVYADFFLKQKQYEQAIPYLKEAIKLNNKRRIKYRLTYVLAQVYQITDKLSEASAAYKNTLGLNPPYVMAFNARINMAKCFDSKSGNSKMIKEELAKMLKDPKNAAYLDQIYYTLGEISLKEKDTINALTNFSYSSANATDLSLQKGPALMTMADIYYAQLNYSNAAIYYDSTLQFLSKKHEKYELINDKKILLSKLVENQTIITLEDSLLKLGALSTKDLDNAIDKIINQLKKEETDKKQAEALKLQQLAILKKESKETDAAALGSGGWYFYNSSAMSFGYNEFIKKWGKRQLEDLWRLKDKKTMDIMMDVDAESISSDSLTKKELATSGVKDKKYYLGKIPNTSELKEKSNEKIKEALYNVGYIYYEGLHDYQKSIETFEKLIQRYPLDPYTIKAYYYLYKIYLNKKTDASKSEYYKNIIISKFPDSDYAKILSDPEYYKKAEKEENKFEIIYADAYLAFLNAQYNESKNYCTQGLLPASNELLKPKFMYLQALNLAKQELKQEMIDTLKSLLIKYPKHAIASPAKELLELAQNETEFYKERFGYETLDNSPQPVKQINQFTLDSSAIYLFAIEVLISNVNVEDIKNAISDFNKTYYNLKTLEIGSVTISKNTRLITVSNFKGIEEAMLYFNSINNNLKTIAEQPVSNYTHFVVSTVNYSMLIRQRNIKSYHDFFQTNFIK